MKALTFQLRLLEPVLVAQAQSGEENSAVGLPFVPGSALRGALVARFLEQNQVDNLAIDAQTRRLFLDGTTCFLNAYPWREEGRLLPTPASWFTEKDRVEDVEAPIVDEAVGSIGDLNQPKPPKGDFCYVSGNSAALYTPPRQVNVHIALLDPNRRDDRNQVYRYDALAEGELLAGAILAGDGVDLADLKALLSPDEIQLGGAHTAGYGRARIEKVEETAYWEEYVPGLDPDDGTVVITLLSDTILRDENGQVGGDLNDFLAGQLGLDGLKPARCYRRWRVVGGFNRKWSLPLAQAWALQAGSVYVYPPQAGLDPDALRDLFAAGVGERRAEGFGRVAVNWHTAPALRRFESTRYHAPPPNLSKDSQALAGRMAERRLRLLLERRLAEAVSLISVDDRPQNAQLSRVRNAAQDGLEAILNLLDNLKGAREQFEKARVGKTPLLRWIEERARQQDVDKQLLKSQALPQVAGQQAELTASLQAEFTARLIDGVMKKAIQQNQEEAT